MNVLIIDADAEAVSELERILSGIPDMHIKFSASGIDARMMLANFRDTFSAVFLDFALPDIEGLDLLKRIRQLPNCTKVPVIVCTAISDRITVAKALQLGVRHYIVKPLKPELVLSKLADATGRPDLQAPAATAAR